MNYLNSRKITIFVTFLVFFIALAGLNIFIVNKNSYQTLSIIVNDKPKNSKILILKADESNNKIKELDTVSTDQKIKKGSYIVVFSGNGYQTQEIKINIDAQPEKVTINPGYSKGKLRELLTIERKAIIPTIEAAFPITKSNYEIEEGSLYKLGQWYGTNIHIKQSAEEERENYIDRYKIILKNDTGKWKVVTIPPEIILSSKKYPNIPRDILVDLNKNPDAN